jgi:two-component system sensor histidine kinase DesK
MKTWQLPTGEDKPAWAALFGAVPMVYLFLDPYQRQASAFEWALTAGALAVFAIFYFAAVLYWSRRTLVLYCFIAMAALGIAFAAYRPSGILFFIYVAALGPIAVGGDIAKSSLIVACAMLLTLIEWTLLRPFSFFPLVTAAEALLVGGATTFVARQQASMRQIVKAAERERIARDLHDILGHTLSVVILKSELAGRLIERNPQRALAEINEIERISRGALSEVREAISGYRTGDLQAEIERAASTLATAGIHLDRDLESAPLSLAHERVLALILREAITNIVRHSSAKSCRIHAKRTASHYHLSVCDDGHGAMGAEGMGMRGIKERITAIGGIALWKPGTPTGTELHVEIPLTDTRSQT